MTRKDKPSAIGSDPFAGVKSPYLVKPTKDETPPAEEKTASESQAEAPADAPQKTFDQRNVQSTLNQLGRELDEFYQDPKSYDRKRLEEVVKTFIHELKNILADTGYFTRIQESISSEERSWKDVFFGLRRFFQSDEVDDYGLDRQLEMTIKPFFDFLYYKYFRVDVEGVSNIPYENRALIVANHSGVIPVDAAMLKVAIFNEHPARRELRFLVDDFVFHFPFMGTIMNRIGGVRACQENAERLLKQEELVSVFPEGIKGISKAFRDRYQLERFGRGGVIRLAMRAKSEIIPTAVIGAEEIYPLVYKSHILARPLGLPFIPFTPLFPWLGPLGMIPLPTKWKVIFGEPISFSEYSTKDLNDDILINRETERVRQVIQDMIKKGLESRRSIFNG